MKQISAPIFGDSGEVTCAVSDTDGVLEIQFGRGFAKDHVTFYECPNAKVIADAINEALRPQTLSVRYAQINTASKTEINMSSFQPRTEYEMTEAELKTVMSSAAMTGSQTHLDVQYNINYAWQALGERYGFQYLTAQPVPEKGKRFFTAVPNDG